MSSSLGRDDKLFVFRAEDRLSDDGFLEILGKEHRQELFGEIADGSQRNLADLIGLDGVELTGYGRADILSRGINLGSDAALVEKLDAVELDGTGSANDGLTGCRHF